MLHDFIYINESFNKNDSNRKLFGGGAARMEEKDFKGTLGNFGGGIEYLQYLDCGDHFINVLIC